MTVKQKQHLLGFLGYYGGAVDGIWGPQSRMAMEDFQRERKVTEEGFGRETEEALLKAVGSYEENRDFWEEVQYFDRREFRCTCGGRGCNGYPVEPEERLVRNAENIRKHFGRAALVSSGVRCALRNRELPGSAANSLHLRGKAMDFCVVGVSSGELLAYVRQLPEVHEAYAIDGNYVHMGVQKY